MNWFKKFWKALNEPAPTTPAPTTTKVTVKSARGASGEDFSSFTPRAQQVLALSRKEADRLSHNFVGTEHVLLGIFKLGQGTAVNVLTKQGLDLELVRQEVEKQVGTGPDQKIIGNIPYTPRVKKVIALAQKEARGLNHTYVGTEHILLGLLREGDGVAARVLRSLGIEVEKTRREILKELDPNFDPSSANASKDSTKETSTIQPHQPQPAFWHPDSVDVSKRYDIYCAERHGEPVVYRNARFKGIKKLFSGFTFQFIELELEDGQTIFVSLYSVIKFCEPGKTL